MVQVCFPKTEKSGDEICESSKDYHTVDDAGNEGEAEAVNGKPRNGGVQRSGFSKRRG